QQQANSYPPVIEDSPARKQAVQEAWKRFLAERQLPEANPDLNPITNTPHALPMELAGRIMLNLKNGKASETEIKEALRQFIDLSREVLGGEDKTAALGLKDLSLVSFINDGNFYRATFRQVNYPFPIAGGYGELHFAVGKNGGLLQLSSTLLPNVSLPARAEVKLESLNEKVLGRELTYTTIAGRPQSYRVTKPEEIKVGDLIVYPKVTGSRMEIHLAYPVTVGEGTTWTVYIDAINGTELGVKQNFAT
ncbi:MAG: hypothetical protein ABI977_13640, partial [Acidobacteriota bacterium]